MILIEYWVSFIIWGGEGVIYFIMFFKCKVLVVVIKEVNDDVFVVKKWGCVKVVVFFFLLRFDYEVVDFFVF